MKPLIDVVIAVYNGASTVRKSIESIQRQTVTDIRVIIIDDGSTDDTCKILNELSESDSRIEVFARPHAGIVASLNYGLSLSNAEFIARFDADDIAYPHRFSTQMAYLVSHPLCLAVSSSYNRIDENDHQVGTKRTPPPINEADPKWVPCREPFLMQTLLMVRKSALDAINGYRLCEVSEDSDLYWRLYELGDMHNIDEALGAYRLNANGISSKSIINGRRMAFWSQLVGISALRRLAGHPDLIMDEKRLKSYKDSTTLEEFCRLGGSDLTEAEQSRLRISASVKLLQFASYRPFELDKEDCMFISQSVKDANHLLDSENRRSVEKEIAKSGLRLLKKGKLIEAYMLVKSNMAYAIAFIALQLLVPNYIRPALKKVLKRGG